MLPADVYTPYNEHVTQSFNRYAYVFNNPLSYTDPSGYFPVIILPAIVITAKTLAATVAGYAALATFTAATVYFTATLLSTSGAVNSALAGSIKGVNYGYFNDYTGTFSNDPGANSFLIRGNQAGVQYPLAPDAASIGASPLATPAPQFPAMAQLAGLGQVAGGSASLTGALPGAAGGVGSLAAGRGAQNRSFWKTTGHVALQMLNLEKDDPTIWGDAVTNTLKTEIPFLATVATPSGTIGAYSKLAQLTKGWKGVIQAHHVVEARHLRVLGLSVSEAPTVILTKAQHQQITNVLRELLPYGKTYSRQSIITAYRQAYKDFPEWIKAAEGFLGF